MNRRLPKFLVLGAQKAGSTWFTRSLRAHPEIYMPLKEVRFFSKHYQLGPTWYENQFSAARTDQLTGEGTPEYLYRRSAAERILETLGPDVRLIVSLRNPVDRAYSSFWSLLGGGVLPVGAKFEVEFEKDCMGLRTRGLYYSQVRRFVDLFGAHGIFISVLELDLGENAPNTLSKVYDFLGVDPLYVPDTALTRANVGGSARRGGARIARVGASVSSASDRIPKPIERTMRSAYREFFKRLPKSREYAPLEAGQRQKYLDYYRADIERVSEATSRDLSVWS